MRARPSAGLLLGGGGETLRSLAVRMTGEENFIPAKTRIQVLTGRSPVELSLQIHQHYCHELITIAGRVGHPVYLLQLPDLFPGTVAQKSCASCSLSGLVARRDGRKTPEPQLRL